MSSPVPSMQPSSRPRNQGVAYTEFLYVSLALILLIVLICLIMCGLKRVCQKKVLGFSHFRCRCQYSSIECQYLLFKTFIVVHVYFNSFSQTTCDWLCGRSQFVDDQDVEVIIETEAVMDDTHYAECDIETGAT